MQDLVALGSQTAKKGFQNEDFVVDCFNNWQENVLAKEWLKAMNYTHSVNKRLDINSLFSFNFQVIIN